jgi:hypothetical protein
MITFHKDIA